MNPTATEGEIQSWPLAIVDGPADVFAVVRESCARANFNEAGVCARFGVTGIVNFTSLREGREQGPRVGDALEVYVDLFMDLVDVSTDHASRLLGDDVVKALLTLGLVRPTQDPPEALSATMLLYPAAGVLLTSDRTYGRPGEKRSLPPDVVYPSVTRNSATFVRMLLPSPCDAFLELCAGNGVAAISMANRARQSWSLDITERSTRVAHFNAHLNGCDNVTALQGDLYEPVRGLTFDRIVAHPPYVASAEQRLIFRDGGPDGELITRRIVTELPLYLRPGGRFYCTCVATDREEGTFEQRLSEWLGDARDEFDIVVSVTTMEHPSLFYFERAMRGAISFSDAEQRHIAFKAMNVQLLVYCSFVIERHPSPRDPAVVRLRRTPVTTGRELEQLCDWLSRREAPDLNQRMLAAYPVIHREAQLRQTQLLVGDKWKEGDTEFVTTWPFVVALQCPHDVAQLLARCDGTRNVKQLIAWLRQKGLLNAGVPDTAVLQTLAACVAAGAVHLEDSEHRAARELASR